MKFSNYKKYLLVGVMMALVILVPVVNVHAQTTSQTPVTITPGTTPAAPTTSQTPTSITPGTTNTATTGTSTQFPNLFSCAAQGTFATCSLYLVALVVNGFMALLLALGAWLVTLGLQFNDNVFNAPAIQIGFSVSLAIANLGFVLGIIIIAIATIIRNQTYGMKQLLWKLVVMAILVNFGLVIAAPIVGFADSMSNYFINATTPAAGSGGRTAYVETLTGAFNPQVWLEDSTAASSGSTSGGSGVWGSICQSSASSLISVLPTITGAINVFCHVTGTPTTNPSDKFWQSLMALLFDIIFSAIAVFTLLCLAVLLIIRYLMLGGLLIVLPLAWLTYIFPKFNSNFSKWWSEFIKWAFFPPLALFFIYLAFTTAVTTNTANNNAAAQYTESVIAGGSTGGSATAPDTSQVQGLATQTGLSGGVFEQAADEILLVGLMIMGLMFAQSLAGKAGAVVVDGATSGAKMVGGYLGKQTKKGARAGFQAVGGRELVKNMRTGEIVPDWLRKRRGLGWVSQKAVGNLGQALEPHLTNAKYVEEEEKKLSSNPKELRENLLNPALRPEQRFAIINKLRKQDDLDDEAQVGIGRKGETQSPQDYLDAHPTDIRNYNQEKPAKDVDKVVGSNKSMREAEKKFNKLAAAGESTTEALKELQNATDAFYEKLKTPDAAKINSNDLFKHPESPLTQAIAKSMFYTSSRLIGKTFPKMKSKALGNAYDMYEKFHNEEMEAIERNATLNEDGKKKARRDADQKWESIKRAHFNNAAGLGGGGGGAAASASSSPDSH